MEALRESFETRVKFGQAVYQCERIIRAGENFQRADATRWAYEVEKWPEVYTDAKRALSECKDLGLTGRELEEMEERLRKLHSGFDRVCRYREGQHTMSAAGGGKAADASDHDETEQLAELRKEARAYAIEYVSKTKRGRGKPSRQGIIDAAKAAKIDLRQDLLKEALVSVLGPEAPTRGKRGKNRGRKIK